MQISCGSISGVLEIHVQGSIVLNTFSDSRFVVHLAMHGDLYVVDV